VTLDSILSRPRALGIAGAVVLGLAVALVGCAAPTPTPAPTAEPTATATEMPPTATATISATATMAPTETAMPTVKPTPKPTRPPVTAAPTAIPATPVPAFVIKFWADQTHLDKETSCTAVNWETSGIKEVYLQWPGQAEEGKGGTGRQENVCIDKGEEVTFKLRVVKQDGSSETREVTIKRDK
jgi:hypothetical protein